MWLVVNDQLRLMYIAVAGRQMQNSMSMLYATQLLRTASENTKRNVISLMKYPENPVDELKLLKFSFVIMIWKLSSFSECYSIDVY